MTGDNKLLHELWQSIEDGGEVHTFCLAGPRGVGCRETLPSDAKLVWTVWASSHYEAMSLYHERQGWGTYSTDQAWDLEPYPAEWIAEQRGFLAAVSSAESEAQP
jgi:hypothetical protein